jgi:hypothetical protein
VTLGMRWSSWLAVGGDKRCSWWREAETLSVGEGEAETVGLVGVRHPVCSGWSAWSWVAAVGGEVDGGDGDGEMRFGGFLKF